MQICMTQTIGSPEFPVRFKVCRHVDGTLSLFHGPRRLARYDADGQLLQDDKSSGQTICTATAAPSVAPMDGRNELPTAA